MRRSGEALDPRAVVAGHKRYGNDDNPRIINETRQYISDFDRLDKETTTAEEQDGPVRRRQHVMKFWKYVASYWM